MELTYPCPCCGYIVFPAKPGSYDICPICRWEDDAAQLRWPTRGGANVPLVDAQANYRAFGVCDRRLSRYARAPNPERERRDSSWRPLKPEDLSGHFDGEANILAVLVEIASPSGEAYYYWRRPPTEQTEDEDDD